MTRRFMPLLLPVLWLGCNGGLFSITVKDSATTTVEQGTLVESLVGSLGFDDFVTMDLTSYDELQNQGVEPGDLQNVRLTLFELEATSPSEADLSFLDSVDLYVEAPDLDRVRIASADDFPEGEAWVSFELDDVDLTDYVASQSMTFQTDVSGRRPDVDTQVEARFEVTVSVTRQGACNNL